jgi:hypothetical protein
MKIVKIGDNYLNLDNVTHAEFETTPHGLVCTVFFNCQITDNNGRDGVQASITFSAADARDLKAWFELRVKTMTPEP